MFFRAQAKRQSRKGKSPLPENTGMVFVLVLAILALSIVAIVAITYGRAFSTDVNTDGVKVNMPAATLQNRGGQKGGQKVTLYAGRYSSAKYGIKGARDPLYL